MQVWTGEKVSDHQTAERLPDAQELYCFSPLPYTEGLIDMGMTTIQARIFNPADASRSGELEFTVDSGAGYSVVPRLLLVRLGIEPHTTKRFYLANGEGIDRQMGIAGFEYLGERTAAPVIFGEEGDAALMGATTLEGFGFVLDPFRRELRPMLMRM
jgi:predicted aspartyl protease